MRALDEAVANGQTALTEHAAKQFLAGYGIPIPREVLAPHADAAADAAHLIGGGGRDVHALPQDLPPGGVDQAVDAAQQGGLAGSAQADHRQELPLGHIETDVLQRQDAPLVNLGEIPYLKHGWFSPSSMRFLARLPASIIKRKPDKYKFGQGFSPCPNSIL
jgi:hypothetical protein